jgi:hypothetical protein
VLRYDGGVTKRNLTEAEVEFNAQREALISKVPSQYVADAPFVFTTRVQTTAMLSRQRLLLVVVWAKILAITSYSASTHMFVAQPPKKLGVLAYVWL